MAKTATKRGGRKAAAPKKAAETRRVPRTALDMGDERVETARPSTMAATAPRNAPSPIAGAAPAVMSAAGEGAAQLTNIDSQFEAAFHIRSRVIGYNKAGTDVVTEQILVIEDRTYGVRTYNGDIRAALEALLDELDG